MKLKSFAIWDEKAKSFVAPFFLPEVGMAVRTFKDCINDKNHAFGKHPEDYTLFRVGTFDTDDGSFESGVEVLHNGVALKDEVVS